MKRFHVDVAEPDQSIRFYSGLFGAPPTDRAQANVDATPTAPARCCG